jgi:similar to stage IV sporulation protein
VKETLTQDKSEKNQYTNIVASDSGQIVEMKIFNGEKIVALKDVVKEGDLLISGISTSQSQGVKYTNASGEVYAIVNKDIKICIPYENEKKTYIGKVYTKKRLKIFSKEINFYINNNKYVEICDKIEKEKQILLFGKYKLPIIIYETRYYPYQIDKTVYSKSEAIDVAMAKLRHDLDVILMNAKLVSKSIKTSNNDTSILVNCNIYIIKNIAREAEFIIEE